MSPTTASFRALALARMEDWPLAFDIELATGLVNEYSGRETLRVGDRRHAEGMLES
jgi:hypothetical protein